MPGYPDYGFVIEQKIKKKSFSNGFTFSGDSLGPFRPSVV